MGMFTGTLGGILRDVLTGQPSVLLRPEIYVTAAAAGAATFVAIASLGGASPVAAAAGFVVALVIRSGALLFGWTLPAYRVGGQPGNKDRS